MTFENNPVLDAQLPKLEEESFVSLNDNYLKISYLSTFIFFGIIFSLMVGAFFYLPFDIPLLYWGAAFLAVFGLLILSLFFTTRAFEKMAYQVRDRDINWQSGLIWRKKVSIPFNRIQHAEVSQGPLERKYKIKSLDVFTAGGGSADLSIPGLPEVKADQLKAFILKKIIANVEEQ